MSPHHFSPHKHAQVAHTQPYDADSASTEEFQSTGREVSLKELVEGDQKQLTGAAGPLPNSEI